MLKIAVCTVFEKNVNINQGIKLTGSQRADQTLTLNKQGGPTEGVVGHVAAKHDNIWRARGCFTTMQVTFKNVTDT